MIYALIGLGTVAAAAMLLWRLKVQRDLRKRRELYDLLRRSEGPIQDLPMGTLVELANHKPRLSAELPSRSWSPKHQATAERKRLAREKIAATIHQHIADFREEQKLCELPETNSPPLLDLVADLLAGKEVEVTQPLCDAWRKEFPEGRLFTHYRIGGRMVDYHRSTGTLVLLEAWH